MKFRVLGNMKLRNKFVLAGTVMTLTTSLFLAIFFFQYLSNQIKDQEYFNTRDMSIQVGNYFDEKFQGLIQRTFNMLTNGLIQNNSYLVRFLLNQEDVSYIIAQSQLSGVISELRLSDKFINSVYIHTPKGDFYELARLKRPGFDFMKTDLYRKMMNTTGFTELWGGKIQDEINLDGKEVIPVVIPFSIEGYPERCYIIINLDVEAIQGYLRSVYSQGEGNIAILANDGDELVSSYDNVDSGILLKSGILPIIQSNGDGLRLLDYDKDQYIIAYRTIRKAPWTIVNIKSRKYLSRNLDRAAIFILGLTTLSVLFGLLVMLLVSGTITKPLNSLQQNIKKVTNRDFTAKFDYPYDDEVGRLGKSFNFMLDEISDLIRRLNATIEDLKREKERVRIEQGLKRKAELKALQEQIKPHFLYNTLNSIIWMADSVNAKDIATMAARLGTLFKIGLSKGKELITIGEELEHVTSYLEIQKIRYGKKLNYSMDVDGGILQRMTIKLILQPFVENAIYHGIKENTRPGHIRITGSRYGDGEGVLLQIEDDGIGMEAPRLEAINRRLQEGTGDENSGYGIYNVNERIRLYFGKDYGVTMQSDPEEKTTVQIRIPLLNGDEVKRYDQADIG